MENNRYIEDPFLLKSANGLIFLLPFYKAEPAGREIAADFESENYRAWWNRDLPEDKLWPLNFRRI